MKTLIFTFLLAMSASGITAQTADVPLASYTGGSITASDLSPGAQEAVIKMPSILSAARKQILSQKLGSALLEKEAAALGTTVSALIKAQTAKIKDPTDAQIKAVYDANQAQIGGRPISEVRGQIVSFVRQEAEQKAIGAYIDTLAAKYKVVNGKDVNAPDLKPADLLFTIAGRSLTAKEFEESSKLSLYNAQADLYDELSAEIDSALYNAVVAEEAKTLKIGPSELVAREITGKMKDYSDAELAGLQEAFRSRLYTKYKAKVLLPEPEAPVLAVSTDDDPARGPANSPVTVVMFSDFQCSACAAVHPILKHVLAGYPDKIRFVVRDFPLESIHENGFRAAKAASAANAQGKFFEYTELLYTRQDALDPASLRKYAIELGLNAKQFDIDFNSEKTAAEIRKDMADGNMYGVNSTPTIFVNGVAVRTFSAAGFRKAIDKALKK
jgi:protein-disulfide isomerase